MRDINEITTEQLREASSKGFVASLGYRSIADNEFDYWLVRERHRVAELAIAKERKRIIDMLEKQAKEDDEAAYPFAGSILWSVIDFIKERQ